jgi:hypothetical protein
VPGLLRIDAHARALVAVPLLLAAEPLVDARARAAGRYLRESGLVAPVAGAYQRAVARTARLRDAALGEVILLAAAAATTMPGVLSIGDGAALRLAIVPSVVVFRFLLLRWIWRWGLWALLLVRLSRLGLAVRASNPDRMAGLGPLLGPAHAFTVVVAGVAAAVAGGWADMMRLEGLPFSAFKNTAIAYAVVAAIVVVLPGCAFAPLLYRTRREGLGGYGAFAHRYAEAFEDRWLGAAGPRALGAPDIQSLADLGNSYDVMVAMRVALWNRRLVVQVVAAAAAPMLPLLLADAGAPALIERIFSFL